MGLFSSEVEHRICNATAVGSIPTKGSGRETLTLSHPVLFQGPILCVAFKEYF